MKTWPRIDEIRSSGWSGAEEEVEPIPEPIHLRPEEES